MLVKGAELVFPRALNSLFLVNFGVQLLTICVWMMKKIGVDIGGLIDNGGLETDKLLYDCKRVLRPLWFIYVSSWISYFLLPSSLIVALGWILTLLIMLNPLDWSGRRSRFLFIRSFFRTVSPLNWKSPTSFIDIIVGDVLTSYAKILAEWDVFIYCYLRKSTTPCLPSILSVILTCYPYFCRFRQCIGDYRSTGQSRSMLNALKYATSFPLIYTTYLLIQNQGWKKFWLELVILNTIYSTIWDLWVDWDFGGRGGRKIESGKTFIWLFPKFVYFVASLTNVLLRLSWMSRILLFQGSGDQMNFIIQLLEIFRRFVWLIFRVEAQQITTINHRPLPIIGL